MAGKFSGRRWALGLIVALLSVTSLLAVPAGALPPPGDPGDPGDPPIPPCIENTRVNSMSVNRRSTFGVSTVRFSWNITKGCPALVLSVDGQTVPAVGSRDVSVPTSRRLTVRGQFGLGGSATYYGPFVVAGRFIGYTQQANGRLGPGQAGGSSGEDSGTDHYSIAVGVDPAQGCIDRMTTTHELGHAVLSYADDDIVAAAEAARAAHLRTPSAPWVGCDDAYSRSNVREYWSEGTAALFDSTTLCGGEYSHTFLATADPPLHRALHQVFSV